MEEKFIWALGSKKIIHFSKSLRRETQSDSPFTMHPTPSPSILIDTCSFRTISKRLGETQALPAYPTKVSFDGLFNPWVADPMEVGPLADLVIAKKLDFNKDCSHNSFGDDTVTSRFRYIAYFVLAVVESDLP
ncbi:hypothetical protein HAX54_048069 [Datura stramonium]|uniref:Uncharacterized protein n=1 Tax=Datura stramonium TaxID=4076 RepID=A0ABS8RQC3_DATST|nr:hypothetical protein [Datura stramonium]